MGKGMDPDNARAQLYSLAYPRGDGDAPVAWNGELGGPSKCQCGGEASAFTETLTRTLMRPTMGLDPRGFTVLTNTGTLYYEIMSIPVELYHTKP